MILNKEKNKQVSELLRKGLNDEEIAKRTGIPLREVIDIVDRLSRK